MMRRAGSTTCSDRSSPAPEAASEDFLLVLEGTFRGFEGEIGRSDEEVLLGSYATPSFPPSLTSPFHPPC